MIAQQTAKTTAAPACPEIPPDKWKHVLRYIVVNFEWVLFLSYHRFVHLRSPLVMVDQLWGTMSNKSVDLCTGLAPLSVPLALLDVFISSVWFSSLSWFWGWNSECDDVIQHQS